MMKQRAKSRMKMKFVLVESSTQMTVIKNLLEFIDYIPAKCPGGLLKFYRGCISKDFHRDQLFFTGVQ